VTTFVLLPGAWHGAWCFDRLITALAERGQRSITVSVPSEDPDAGCERYADAVAATIPEDVEDPVLVAHSLGGLTAPLVPERRALGGIVMLAAMIPIPGVSLDEQHSGDSPPLASTSAGGRELDELGRSYWANRSRAIELLYNDCDSALAEWAATRLEPQSQLPSTEPSPLSGWPEVPTSYVICAEDRLMDEGWSRAAPRDRLGVEPMTIPSGHCPMISRPDALAGTLIELAH
jgi:pimeloyl-ACP methyl ester carboxylesterase